MKSKYYALAGLRLRIDSLRAIAGSKLYRAFYALPGDSDLCVRITEEPAPTPAGQLVAQTPGRQFYHDETGLTLVSTYPSMHGDVSFACRKTEGRQITLYLDHPGGLWDAMVFHALNLPELLADRGIFLFHSSYILYRGCAVLFSADQGGGKSTQAALWEAHRGAEIINGDRSLLAFSGNCLFAHGTPYCGSSQIARNCSAPVKAIIFLKKGAENEIHSCGGADACLQMMAQLSYERHQATAATDLALRVCGAVPIYQLTCRPEESAVALLEETLWKSE